MVEWPRQADSAGYNRKIYGSIYHMEANKAKRQVYPVELSITCHVSVCTKLTMKGCYSKEELLELFRNKKSRANSQLNPQLRSPTGLSTPELAPPGTGSNILSHIYHIRKLGGKGVVVAMW